MSVVTSDPHAWLRPIYARLRADTAFARLAPAHQFASLCQAATEESPSKAALMREGTSAAEVALLSWLADVIEQHPSPPLEVELWRLRKDGRELRCVAAHLVTGIDLRLLEGDDFRRKQLLKDRPAIEARAEGWRSPLVERGST